MSEPQMIVFGTKRGRPSRAGVRATERIDFLVTPDEREQLQRVAFDAGKPLAAVIREAVNEYVSDYGEKRVFRRPAGYQPE